MKTFLIVLAVVLMTTLAVTYTLWNHKYLVDLHEKFPELNSTEHLNGLITDLKVIKGACFVTLGTKHVFIKSRSNYLYNDIYLSDVISIGDSLAKNAYSDTVFVYKFNKVYYFDISQNIEKP